MRRTEGLIFGSCARAIRGGSVTWLGGAPSSRASLASGLKWYPFCCSLGSAAQEEEEVQRQEREDGWVRGHRMGAGGP